MCYCNAVRNANAPIWHNIVFLRITLGIDVDNNEITPDISSPTVYFTNEQRVLLSNFLTRRLFNLQHSTLAGSTLAVLVKYNIFRLSLHELKRDLLPHICT